MVSPTDKISDNENSLFMYKQVQLAFTPTIQSNNSVQIPSWQEYISKLVKL